MKHILIICSLILFYSCDRDKKTITPEEPEPAPSVTPSLFPMSVGNYWVYQLSNDDSLGNLNLQNGFDSVYVEADTMIASEHYYKFRHSNTTSYAGYYSFGNATSVQYLRDSSGYIVNANHQIVLDKTHINDTINRYIISPAEYVCTVPHTFSQKTFLIGTHSGNCMDVIYFRNIPAHYVIDVSSSTYYVNGIGTVRSYYSYASCLNQCRYSHNLIRYHGN